MASIQTEGVEQVDNVRLRVLVDKEKNKVVYAEAGKDFVDALFSFRIVQVVLKFCRFQELHWWKNCPRPLKYRYHYFLYLNLC